MKKLSKLQSLIFIVVCLFLTTCSTRNKDKVLENEAEQEIEKSVNYCTHVMDSYLLKEVKLRFEPNQALSFFLRPLQEHSAELFALECNNQTDPPMQPIKIGLISLLTWDEIKERAVRYEVETFINSFDIAFDANYVLLFQMDSLFQSAEIACSNTGSCGVFEQELSKMNTKTLRSIISTNLETQQLVHREFAQKESVLIYNANQPFDRSIETERRLVDTLRFLNGTGDIFLQVKDMNRGDHLISALAEAAVWYSCYQDDCHNGQGLIPAEVTFRQDGMYAIVTMNDFWQARDFLLGSDFVIDLEALQPQHKCNSRGNYDSELQLFLSGCESYGGDSIFLRLLDYQRQGDNYIVRALRIHQKGMEENIRFLTKDGTPILAPAEGSIAYPEFLLEHQALFPVWEFVVQDQQERLMRVISARVLDGGKY